jgi:glycosyltransferase involved in cell wall biosynthesis
MKLSILIPIYNEVNTINKLLQKIETLPMEKEIILVDDCSTDGSRGLIQEKNNLQLSGIKTLYHNKNLGKGAAVKTALSEASGDYTIIQDADLEYEPSDYVLLLDAAQKENADIVYGSRFLTTWRTSSWWHFLVNRFLTTATNILFGSHLTDMETCYKLIRTNVFKSLDIKSERFEIEPEITAKLLKRGYRIIEVPISYKGRAYHEGKKIGWQDGISTLITLLRYKFCK